MNCVRSMVQNWYWCVRRSHAMKNSRDDKYSYGLGRYTHEVELINCMKVTDVIGLNFEEDSLDAGTHLNESGGKKVSRYIAEYLKENVLK